MELALAPTLAAQAPVPTRPNRATQRSVPAFLNKLYSMVADQSTDDLIRWSDDGDSFFVPSADRFGKELLPRFFKHSNFGSFVRQLNMYGFHKVPHLQQGVLKRDQSEEADVLEFSNPHFMRGQPDLLCMIKRQKAGKGETAAAAAVAAAAAAGGGPGSSLSLDGRSSSATGSSSHAAASLNIATLLSDLAAIRKHQTAISADLKDLQARNHALWQEAVQSREKHKKQEETINKILRFLAGVFGGQVLDHAGAAGQQHPQVVEGAASPISTTSSAASPPQTTTAGSTAAAASATSKAGGGGTNGSATKTGTSGSGTRKGNGNGAGVVLMPKSRLLLEDVKGRQRQRRAALRELDGEEEEEEEEEDERSGRRQRHPRPRRRRVKTEEEEEERSENDGVEIEEIPLLNAAEDEEDMPVISSALITSSSTALTRAPSHSHSAYLPTTSSSSRFTALPYPVPAFASEAPRPTQPPPPTSSTNATNGTGSGSGSGSGSLIDPAQYNLPAEALKALLTAAGDNPQALQDFFLRATNTTSNVNGNGNYDLHQGVLIPSSAAAAGVTSFMNTSVAPPLSSSSPWTSLAGPSAPSTSSSSEATTSSALLQYSYAQPHYTSNPLDFGASSNPSFAATPTSALGMTTTTSSAAALPSPVNFEMAVAENNDVLSSVLTEKADIDQRTAALENQIAKLLDHLPDDAREEVENEAANGDNSSWAGIDWENYTNDDGGVDFDKMLAQLSEISSNGEAPIDYSELLSNNALDPTVSGAASSISSAPTPTSTSAAAMIDPSLYGLGTELQQQQPPQAYEVTSPAETPTASSGGGLRGAAAEEEEEHENLAFPASSIHSFASTASSRKGPAAAAGAGAGVSGGKGKKRKSEAIAEPAAVGADDEPATGARRSTRRKRS